MTHTRIRTAGEREMRRWVRRGALIMAEYDWPTSGIPALRERGRKWALQVPTEGKTRASRRAA